MKRDIELCTAWKQDQSSLAMKTVDSSFCDYL